MALSPSDPALALRLELARELAARAGAIQRERFETGLSIETKSATIDLVTEVDRACEALIADGLRAHLPADAILAEEGHGDEDGDGAFRWVIDPLDGTTNFAHGFPRFCVSIGVERRGERAIGVVYDPLLDERFEAALGEGAWLGTRRLRVSQESELGRSLIATGFAYDVHHSDEDNLESFRNVVKTARGIRRDGSAALDLCYVAAGFLMVEEAGGRLSDLRGGPGDPSGKEVVSSNGAVHEALLAQLVPTTP